MLTFEDFFQAIHGHSPFPWQAEAARRLLEGLPIEAVTVPTGCGKTAMIDASVFAAAHGGPKRIFFIIDRRVVVDEAFDRAERIREGLDRAVAAPLREIARLLGPLRIVRLRGGLFIDDDWVWQSEGTTIVLSTVDQVGSRLLHRGYGVSPRMWPLHAGFVGNKALYLVDEAHLSRPFIETVRAAQRYGAGVRLIEMSATLAEEKEAQVGLSEADRKHDALRRRLSNRKLAQLEEAPDGDADFAELAADRAEGLLSEGKVIGIVVNRVKSARRIWQELTRRKQHAVLLIGRVRPWDRDRLMGETLPLIRTGRARSADQPLFVVATQTIEVGADLDFDGLVTEAAPLTALRQRFGRLDRLGEIGSTRAVILGRSKDIGEKDAARAAVYGEDIRNTWLWLHGIAANGPLDFGPDAMSELLLEYRPPLERDVHCPTLLPTHIDLFSQTGPDAPAIDPAPWLHGPRRVSSDVNVIWRADLDPEAPALWAEHVLQRPPLAREAVQVPIGALLDLLNCRDRADIADIEGVGEESNETQAPRLCLVWRGPDDCSVPSRFSVHPGDTVVIPAAYGGHDVYGWHPGERVPVRDIAEECALETEQSFALRLCLVVADWLGDAKKPVMAAVAALRRELTEFAPEEGVNEAQVQAAWQALLDHLSRVDHPFVKRLGTNCDFVLLPKAGVVLYQRTLEEIAGANSGGVAVMLDDHLAGVRRWAERIAGDDPDAVIVAEAARQHDLGKSAPGFQALLYGDPLKAARGPVLAKSGLRNRAAQRSAWERSGLPRGFRHELHSLTLSGNADPLLSYLVATHHGYGRPWFPPCEAEAGMETVALAAGWAGRFAALRREHNPWRLAELELMLRTADIRCSQEEQSCE